MSENFFNLEKNPTGKKGKEPGERKQFTVSVIVLLVVIVAVGAFVFAKEYNGGKLLSTIVPEEREETETEEIAEETEITEEVKETAYRETAQRGEGATHLARRAISKHLQETGEEVSAEKRIYMEDYVQKRVSPEHSLLEVGEEIEISSELIEEALEKADDLSPDELQNLQQYVPLVYF